MLHRARQLIQAGRFGEARALCEQALQADPANALSLYLLGTTLYRLGDLTTAVERLAQAIQADPSQSEFHNQLGLAYLKLKRSDDAAQAFAAAINLAPQSAHYVANSALVHSNSGRLDEAIATLRQAVAMQPDLGEIQYNLANHLSQRGDLDAAIQVYEKVIAFRPDLIEPYNNLANALKDQGRVDEAIAVWRRVLQRAPRNRKIRSNLISALHYSPCTTGDDVLHEAKAWNDAIARPLLPRQVPHSNDTNPRRPLRLGYASPAFRNHPQGYFIEPILRSHDRCQFQVYCYSDAAKPDDLTGRLQGYADTWRDTGALTDQQLAALIRQDGIDILVDLSWHTANNRLLTFAHRPAPVQVTWGDGPVATTGLQTIDYAIVDRYHCPPGAARRFVEELVVMPHGYICYQPPASAPDFGPPPLLTHGVPTFGSFNTLPKLHPTVIETWAKLLHRVAEAKLILKAKPFAEAATRQRVAGLFASHGIDPARIELQGPASRHELLTEYGRVDIALDPFPYQGGVTTLEALWMGVPVIALRCPYTAANHAISHLSNAGLPELIADTVSDYVNLAVQLADDPTGLAQLRANLRSQLAASPLCDGQVFTRDLELAYRGMWRAWCAGAAATP